MDRALPGVNLLVGLTGGIGSGKTLVAERLQRLGAAVVDTDEISRQLTGAGGAAIPALTEAFGSRVLTREGALDREGMRALAFSDAAARARLEAILHPAIRAEADRALARASGAYALLVVPLLFETRAYLGRVDRTLVVDCAEEVQVHRVTHRSGLDEAQVRSIMAAQWPRWRRLQVADDVIWNGGDRDALERQCEMRHRAYCERALASPTIRANSRQGR
jgi:dephospho-CoA kinase